jgi:hypothetical protein
MNRGINSAGYNRPPTGNRPFRVITPAFFIFKHPIITGNRVYIYTHTTTTIKPGLLGQKIRIK